jgi:uncharacterized protein YbaP (TraB family)
MRKTALLNLAVAWLSCSGPAVAQATTEQPSQAEVQEIVVTARRSGIPVWTVTSPATTVILVGAIENVSKDTRWNADNLTDALRKADRVMFPQEQDYKASPFAMIGFAIRILRTAKLPKGKSLTQMMSPEQFARLTSLHKRGILKAGFERRNPLHLAMELHQVAEGKTGLGTDAYEYTRKAIKKHKIRMVPLPKLKLNKSVNAVLTAPPQAHVPCLLASARMVAAGPDTLRQRSLAWSERRVPDALASPAEDAFETCAMNEYLERSPDWRATMRRVLNEPQLTVAVLNLASLAQPGGLLDELSSAGFDIRGPRWKR